MQTMVRNGSPDHESTLCRQEPASLRELYCQAAQCPAAQFEERFLNDCLCRPWLSRLGLWLDHDFFAGDLEFVRMIGNLRSFTDCRYEISEYRRDKRPKGLLRRGLKLRLSGQEATRIASKLFLHHTMGQRAVANAPNRMTAAVAG